MIKILYYPKNDEYLYSFLSRYHLNSPNDTWKESRIDLFNKDVQLNFHFQQKMESLANVLSYNTKNDINLDFLMNEMLLLKLIKPFTSEKKYNNVLELYKSTGNGLYKLSSFYSNERLKEDNFRIKICPICFEDENKNDVAYIHRSHNAPGVKVCTKHNCYLQSIEFDKHSINNFININKGYHPETVKYPQPNLLLQFLNYNEDIEFILSGALDGMNLDKIVKKMKTELNLRGLYNNNAKQLRELNNDITSYFSEEYLDEMDSLINKTDNKSTWVNTMLFNFENQYSIIKRLLLLRILFGSIKELVDYNKEFINNECRFILEFK